MIIYLVINSYMNKGEEACSFLTVRTGSYRQEKERDSASPTKTYPSFQKVKEMEKVELQATTTHSNSKIEGTLNSKQEEDSYRDDFEEIVREAGQLSKKDGISDRLSIESCFRKVEVTPSAMQEKAKLLAKSTLTADLCLKCMLSYAGKIVETQCRLSAGQLHFSSVGLIFRLGKITKMKVMYQEYQRCIWFTYQDIRSTRNPQTKFKVHIPNDIKDDLYLLFARIIVQKLTLISFDINLRESDDDQVDRFIMAGELLKKSQFFGKWAARKIVITDRIESYKSAKCTFEMKNIKEIWTRFDVVENCLVLKVRHGLEKTELALPIVNYPARFCKNNWMYRIYRLLSASLT